MRHYHACTTHSLALHFQYITLAVLPVLLGWILVGWREEEEKHKTFSIQLDRELNYTRNVWTFWTEDLPSEIERMVVSLRSKFRSPWTFHFLTNANVSRFLDLQTFPPEFPLLTPQKQANYIRVCLVERYGGWWLDSSSILKTSDVLEKWIEEAETAHATFLGFCNPEDGCPKKVIENGIFYAPKGSAYIKAWQEQLDYLYSVGAGNYLYWCYREGVTFRPKMFKPYPIIDNYFCCFAAMQYALERSISRQLTILTKNVFDHFYEYDRDCHHRRKCLHDVLLRELKDPRYRISKMYGWHRTLVFGQELYKHPPEVVMHKLRLGISLPIWHVVGEVVWCHFLVFALALLIREPYIERQ